MINIQSAQPADNTDKLLQDNRPSDFLLSELASQPKMTFARMARELAVDRKTVRRWCRDLGIEKCGVKRADGNDGGQGDNVTKLPGQATDKPAADIQTADMQTTDMSEVDAPATEKPEVEKPIPSVDDLLQTILARQSWLTEYLVIMHERLRAIETGMSGLSCPLPQREMGRGEILVESSPERNLYTMIMQIAAKLGARDDILEPDEQDMYDDFAAICRAALAEDIARLKIAIDNHWHQTLCISDSKQWQQERRARAEGYNGIRRREEK